MNSFNAFFERCTSFKALTEVKSYLFVSFHYIFRIYLFKQKNKKKNNKNDLINFNHIDKKVKYLCKIFIASKHKMNF